MHVHVIKYGSCTPLINSLHADRRKLFFQTWSVYLWTRHLSVALANTNIFFFTVYCEEWKTGHGSLLSFCHWHEPGCGHFQPPGPDPAPQQWNPRRGRHGGAAAEEEKVQADGGDGGREKVLFQMCLQTHRCRHHRHLRQGRLPFHLRSCERDLLGGIHHVSGRCPRDCI